MCGKIYNFSERQVIEMLATVICVMAAVEIDYGASEIYTRADMDSAIEIVQETFGRWRGCKLHNIRYVGDDANNAENLRWLNELAPEQNFTQVIEFLSDFYVSAEAGKFTAFNPDSEYKNWQWWLARTDGGVWQLVTFGY